MKFPKKKKKILEYIIGNQLLILTLSFGRSVSENI